MPELTLQSLNLLLARLDADESKAAAEYEELRLKTTKTLMWKGCPESRADALADEVFDRVAAKLAEGVVIENIKAYTAQVMRFVWLEHFRKNKEDGYDDDDLPEIEVAPVLPQDADLRMACLRLCLASIPKHDDERRLILDYYDADEEAQDKRRRISLAERLGISKNSLKVKMFRLRERLEKCINECVAKRLKRVTD